ncbi:MAG: hypothetical protein RBR03_04875 [Desulfuromonas thiophila]|jgi:hypothetical protein|nr:hypothetical protein [Desulfuromonas thiophila]MDY0397971.1 hypothetical protein [Desulfuromonas thiophila]
MTTPELRTLAKMGMTAALAALVVSAAGTGNRRRRIARHTWQGLALVGFSVWHYNLYSPARTSSRAGRGS